MFKVYASCVRFQNLHQAVLSFKVHVCSSLAKCQFGNIYNQLGCSPGGPND